MNLKPIIKNLLTKIKIKYMKTSMKLLIVTIAAEFILTLAGIVVLRNTIQKNIVFGSNKIISEKTIIKPFRELSIQGDITVHWKKSDSAYIRLKMDETLAKEITVNSNEMKLFIKGPDVFRKTKTVITVFGPSFRMLSMDKGCTFFTDDTLCSDTIHICSMNGSNARLKTNNQLIHIESINGSDVQIIGKTDVVEAEVKNGSVVKVDHLQIRKANVQAFSGSSVSIMVSDTITATASSGSNIDLYGNPIFKQIHTDESSSINQ